MITQFPYLSIMSKSCNRCGRTIFTVWRSTNGKFFHPHCFTCAICDCVIQSADQLDDSSLKEIYCSPCFKQYFKNEKIDSMSPEESPQVDAELSSTSTPKDLIAQIDALLLKSSCSKLNHFDPANPSTANVKENNLLRKDNKSKPKIGHDLTLCKNGKPVPYVSPSTPNSPPISKIPRLVSTPKLTPVTKSTPDVVCNNELRKVNSCNNNCNFVQQQPQPQQLRQMTRSQSQNYMRPSTPRFICHSNYSSSKINEYISSKCVKFQERSRSSINSNHFQQYNQQQQRLNSPVVAKHDIPFTFPEKRLTSSPSSSIPVPVRNNSVCPGSPFARRLVRSHTASTLKMDRSEMSKTNVQQPIPFGQNCFKGRPSTSDTYVAPPTATPSDCGGLDFQTIRTVDRRTSKRYILSKEILSSGNTSRSNCCSRRSSNTTFNNYNNNRTGKFEIDETSHESKSCYCNPCRKPVNSNHSSAKEDVKLLMTPSEIKLSTTLTKLDNNGGQDNNRARAKQGLLDCPICFEALLDRTDKSSSKERNSENVVTGCDRDCINNWLNKNGNSRCPICSKHCLSESLNTVYLDANVSEHFDKSLSGNEQLLTLLETLRLDYKHLRKNYAKVVDRYRDNREYETHSAITDSLRCAYDLECRNRMELQWENKRLQRKLEDLLNDTPKEGDILKN